MVVWLQHHMLPCTVKLLFGIDCSICGFQRSFILLLQGNFAESFRMYPPLLPALVLLLLIPFRFFKPTFLKGVLFRRYSIFVLVVIGVSYAVKLISYI